MLFKRFVKDLKRYFPYSVRFAKSQLKTEVAGSYLGWIWWVLQPLCLMFVYSLVFGVFFNAREEYMSLFIFIGLTLWNFFSHTINHSVKMISANKSMLMKVYVPKFIYPLTKVLSASINVLLSMIPLILVTLIYGLIANPHLFISKSIVLLPFALLFLLVFCLGIGFLLSCLMAFFHDIEFLWGVISTVWMYGTPIIYSLSMFEGKADWLITVIKFNPMYHLVELLRGIIMGNAVGTPTIPEFLISAFCAAIMFAFGYFVFKKNEDKFILYL